MRARFDAALNASRAIHARQQQQTPFGPRSGGLSRFTAAATTMGRNAFARVVEPLIFPHLNSDEVIAAFHKMMGNAIIIAVEKGLIPQDDLESIEPSVVINSPKLALLAAALLTDSRQNLMDPESGKILTRSNCPPDEAPIYKRWREAARLIKALDSRDLGTLFRLSAGAIPESELSTVSEAIKRIDSKLTGIAIDISQRDSFKRLLGRTLERATEQVGSVEMDPVQYGVRETVVGAFYQVLLGDEERGIPSNSLLPRIYKNDPERGLFAAIGLGLLTVMNHDGRIDGINLATGLCATHENCPDHLKGALKYLLELKEKFQGYRAEDPRFLQKMEGYLFGIVSIDPDENRPLADFANLLRGLTVKIVEMPTFQAFGPEALAALNKLQAN